MNDETTDALGICFDPQNDFEKLLFAHSWIRELQQQNLRLYDDVLDLKDDNRILMQRLKTMEKSYGEMKQKYDNSSALNNESRAILRKDEYINTLATSTKKALEDLAAERKKNAMLANELIKLKNPLP